MQHLTFATACSGIESASVAWEPLGWRPVFFAEVDRFCCSVLRAHFPQVPNYGNLAAFTEWPDHESIDVLAAGTPCQSFSHAGNRGGLADARGDLALTFVGLAARYRPRWLVWENVPGVLSSNGGHDFAAFVGALGECGYGWAYRILDAEYFGVPQQRRRVFLVGHLGDWHAAAAVLLERHSLQGHPAPRRPSPEGLAPDLAACLDANFGRLQGASGQDARHGHSHLIPEASLSLSAAQRRLDPTVETFVIEQPAAQAFMPARTLAADGGVDERFALRDVSDAVHGSTGSGNKAPLIVHAFDARQTDVCQYGEQAPLDTQGNSVGVLQASRVRRLTPTECERLQGLPDGWTHVLHRGRPAKDKPRYRAIGNAWCVPVARWIGERIEAVEQALQQAAPVVSPVANDDPANYRWKSQVNPVFEAFRTGVFHREMLKKQANPSRSLQGKQYPLKYDLGDSDET